MASQEDVMRLVAEVVDKFSGPLKDMNKSFRDAGKASTEANREAAKAAREHAKHIKELQERIEKTKDFVADAFVPALGVLGIAGFATGETFARLTEKIKAAGEQYNVFIDISKRGGVSTKAVDVMQMTFERLGLSAEKANTYVSTFGEIWDKLKRGNPQEMNRLQSEFGNIFPVLRQLVDGAKTYEEAQVRILEAIGDRNLFPNIDQRRKLAAAIGIDPDMASRDLDEIKEAREKALKDAAEHPLNIEAMKRLDEVFTNLNQAQKMFWRDMVNANAEPAVKAIEKITHSIEWLDHALRSLDESIPPDSWLGKSGKLFGFEFGKSPQRRIEEGFDAFGRADAHKSGLRIPANEPAAGIHPISFGGFGSESDAEKMLTRGVKEGVLDALREWVNSSTRGAGGFTNASYQPGGGSASSFRFGSREYPLLDGSTAPGSTRDTIGRVMPDGIGAYSGSRVGSAFDRSRFAAELKAKPWLKEKIFQLAAGEDRPSRGESLMANQAVMETMMNRAIMRGTSLETQAKWYGREAGGYYAGRPSRLSDLERRNSEENLRRVLGGSNITDYATDNSSGGLAAREKATGKFRFHRAFNGESFFSPGWAERGFQRRWEALRKQVDDEETARAARGASLRDHIRHRSLSRVGPQSMNVKGDASVRISLDGFPKGTRTKTGASGLFKEVKLDRGRTMAMASTGD